MPGDTNGRATWGLVLALLGGAGLGAAAGSTSGCGSAGSCDDPVRPADHPCASIGGCGQFEELPDGGAAPFDADAGTKGGTVRFCGCCNG